MEKHLVTIEFRYSAPPRYEDDYTGRTKKITIGIYDDFDDACVEGNKVLETLESKYKLNPNYNRKERFSKNGGSFGSKRNLISNLGYLETPFTFFAKITTLKYGEIDNIIDEVADSVERYRECKIKEDY